MNGFEHCPFELNIDQADYSVFGETFYEEVAIAHQSEGRLFWLNLAWFYAHGIDVGNASNRLQVESWLLDSFCVQTCEQTGPAEVSARADRYGGFSGTAHGGSGRCLYRGLFNVKGVGRTPLVPSGLSSHTDGRYLLVEAIRGAIYSELAHHECIAGAIRTIAIIQLPPFDLPPEERRCLIVRQNFVRPAHFERSLFFGTAGFEGSDQERDHRRVQTVRQALSDQGIGWRQITECLARQMGSLDAMRMSQGRFTSSNMSLDGKVADFETFRIFDSWFYKKQVNRDRHVFGKELELLKKSALRWSQLIGKDDAGNVPEVAAEFHREGFLQTMRFVVPPMGSDDPSSCDRFLNFLYDTFLSHSRLRMSDPDGWIVDPDIASEEFSDQMIALAGSFGFDETASIVIAARMNAWRLSRAAISLKEINSMAVKLIALGDEHPEDVHRRVSEIVWTNRRLFNHGENRFAPVLSIYREGIYSLYVVDMKDRAAYELRWGHGLGGLGDSAAAAMHARSKTEVYDAIRSEGLGSVPTKVQIYNEWMIRYLA